MKRKSGGDRVEMKRKEKGKWITNYTENHNFKLKMWRLAEDMATKHPTMTNYMEAKHCNSSWN